MLVLSRKVGEQVIINDNICVTVTEVHGNQVRLGFSAPEEVLIRRFELVRSPQSPRKQLRQSAQALASNTPRCSNEPMSGSITTKALPSSNSKRPYKPASTDVFATFV